MVTGVPSRKQPPPPPPGGSGLSQLQVPVIVWPDVQVMTYVAAVFEHVPTRQLLHCDP
jgi:hypothetical protein